MYQSTHASVGQNQGRLPYAQVEGLAGNCKLQNENCKLQNSIVASQTPVTSHQSPRSGISLTEVLIAMGILTVGLLGVASVFPVASFYMQKGDVADRGSAIAQAAFNEALSRGVIDPANWLMFEDRSGTGFSFTTYSKRFQTEFKAQLAANVTATGTALQKQQRTNNAYGNAYVIDPLAADGSPLDASDPLNRTQARFSQTLPFNSPGSINYGYSYWWPWNPTAAQVNQPRWPLVRVTLPQAGQTGAWAMTSQVADRRFRSSDDLALDMPAQANRPSQQTLARFDLNGDNAIDPLARNSRGDYSWLATVVPTTPEARDALATDPSAYSYEVSIAVFYKRVLDNLAADSTFSERLTMAKVVSAGLSGGEVLVETTDTAQEPFATLKVGNWILMCGPSPLSTSSRPHFVARWYRVLSISKEAPGVITNQTTQRLVGLRGPQWPWQPAANLTDTNALSNNLCLCIVPNVVAVHSKTIKLGGQSSWSVQ